jgi:hypothetical protein
MSATAPTPPATAAKEKSRTGALTTLCIVAVVVALFAFFAAAMQLANSSGQNPFQSLSEIGQPPEVVRLQREMQAQIALATRPWAGLFVVLAGANGLLGVLLVAGSVLALRSRPLSRPLLWAGFALGFVTDLVGLVPGFAVQRATFAALDGMFSTMMSRAPAAPNMAGFADTMQGVMRASMVMGAVMGGAMVLAKLGYYVWASLYLRRPEVRERLAGAPRA